MGEVEEVVVEAGAEAEMTPVVGVAEAMWECENVSEKTGKDEKG